MARDTTSRQTNMVRRRRNCTISISQAKQPIEIDKTPRKPREVQMLQSKSKKSNINRGHFDVACFIDKQSLPADSTPGNQPSERQLPCELVGGIFSPHSPENLRDMRRNISLTNCSRSVGSVYAKPNVIRS